MDKTQWLYICAHIHTCIDVVVAHTPQCINKDKTAELANTHMAMMKVRIAA